MINFDIEQVIALHDLSAKVTGGAEGIRDYGLLQSAVYGIYQTFGGEELYHSIEEKCARLGYNIINNHVFVDGNKRTGCLAMLTLLEMNGIKIKYTDQEIISLGFGMATGELTHRDVTKWIHDKKELGLCK